ncbi:hypothetical protein [Mycoplasma sp. HS2188]|uniref:hypothetical protein n=1 Tax=Mycoplasma sp. HS2188 TaxID=2976765 RepID=UPI0021AAC575|nr:hypothetical protein [Mycoplasma sp. HS2188]MCT4469679.1 hypothetical protein [Mycoplasma sp. HS2188]
MKKIALSSLLTILPILTASCSTNNIAKQDTKNDVGDQGSTNNIAKQITTNNIEKYSYLDFLKSQPHDNKILILENDLTASEVFPGFLVYNNFELTEDIDWDEVPDAISNFKISNVFNKEFFKDKFLVYISNSNTTMKPIQYRDKDYLVSQSLAPFDYSNGKVVYGLSILPTVSDYAPNVQLPKEYEFYFTNSLTSLFVAFDKKQYDNVIEIIKKITNEDQQKLAELEKQKANNPQGNTNQSNPSPDGPVSN